MLVYIKYVSMYSRYVFVESVHDGLGHTTIIPLYFATSFVFGKFWMPRYLATKLIFEILRNLES